MDIKLLDLRIKPSTYRVGEATIEYGKMIIRCDLCYFEKDDKMWMRMPEVWAHGKKFRYCWWPTKESSDEFQELLLKLIFDQFGVTKERAASLHKAEMVKLREKKKMDKISS